MFVTRNTVSRVGPRERDTQYLVKLIKLCSSQNGFYTSYTSYTKVELKVGTFIIFQTSMIVGVGLQTIFSIHHGIIVRFSDVDVDWFLDRLHCMPQPPCRQQAQGQLFLIKGSVHEPSVFRDWDKYIANIMHYDIITRHWTVNYCCQRKGLTDHKPADVIFGKSPQESLPRQWNLNAGNSQKSSEDRWEELSVDSGMIDWLLISQECQVRD